MVKFSQRFTARGGGGVPAILWIIFAIAVVAGLFFWWTSQGGIAAIHVLGKVTAAKIPSL